MLPPSTAESRPPEKPQLRSCCSALCFDMPSLELLMQENVGELMLSGPTPRTLLGVAEKQSTSTCELLTLRAAMHFQAGFRDDTHIFVVLDINHIYNYHWLMSAHCFNVDLCNS